MLDRLIEKLDAGAMLTAIVSYLPNLFAAVLLAILFWVVLLILKRLLGTALRKANVPEDASDIVLRFTGYAVGIIAMLTIAGQLGIKITSLIAGLGVAGLALSFAAQDTVANVISGITLLIDRPFKKGDWIRVGDIHAAVTQIKLRTTVLTTFDNETLVMPNKMLAQERIVNHTLTPRIRVKVPVGIAYKESIESARRAMLSTLAGDDRILDSPAPSVVVTGLGDSSVNLELRFWAHDPLIKFALMFEYTEKCKNALDEAGIEIPFPHLQLFLEKSDGLMELVKTRTDRSSAP